MELNQISERIIGCAIDVHRELGPGLLESSYETCLAFAIAEAGLSVERQRPLPLTYKGVTLQCGYRVDLVVEDSVLIEIKSIETLASVHLAQMLAYLKLSERELGLIINFNVKWLVDGIKRVRRGFPAAAF